jgi:hypothetical protein
MTPAQMLLACLSDTIQPREPSIERDEANAELLRIFGDMPAQLRELREQYNTIHDMNRHTHGGKE